MNKQADNEDIRNNSPDYKKYDTAYRFPFGFVLNPKVTNLLYSPPDRAYPISANMS
jgi:hypothetical protein